MPLGILHSSSGGFLYALLFVFELPKGPLIDAVSLFNLAEALMTVSLFSGDCKLSTPELCGALQWLLLIGIRMSLLLLSLLPFSLSMPQLLLPPPLVSISQLCTAANLSCDEPGVVFFRDSGLKTVFDPLKWSWSTMNNTQRAGLVGDNASGLNLIRDARAHPTSGRVPLQDVHECTLFDNRMPTVFIYMAAVQKSPYIVPSLSGIALRS